MGCRTAEHKTSESVIAEDDDQSNIEEGDGGEEEIEGDFAR